MKAAKLLWIGITIAFSGCTQLLDLDQDYQSTPSSANSSGTAGMGGSGGMAGSGGGATCNVDADCPTPANNCTVNHCVANVCIADNLPQGTSCSPDGKAVCNGNGICGQCNDVNDCTMLPPDDECQQRVCNDHVCAQTFTAAGTLLKMQTVGDCKDASCDGSGKTSLETNNMDLPNDNNPCTKNLCTNGSPSFPAEPINTPCGMDSKCNDKGQCIGCFVVEDCPGTDDFCKTRTCIDNICGFSFTPAGTDLASGQTSGDCKIKECDNQGNIVASIDNTDLPIDGKPCTKDVCTAGVPSNPLESTGTSCGGGSTCNADGICEKPNGNVCTVAADCQSGHCVEGYCCNSACGQTCKSCNVPGSLGLCTTVPAGYSDNSCPSPKSCDGTTGGNACVTKYPMGYPCSQNAQCGGGICIDGVCCSTACPGTCQACNVTGSLGTCTNVPLGQSDGATCSGANACDGNGGCKKSNGQTCTIAGDCVSGTCIDGVCCGSACLGTCQACNVTGSTGTCVNVLSGQEDPVATTACMGNYSCNGAGACLLDPGQPCMINGECASNNCSNMTCQ